MNVSGVVVNKTCGLTFLCKNKPNFESIYNTLQIGEAWLEGWYSLASPKKGFFVCEFLF